MVSASVSGIQHSTVHKESPYSDVRLVEGRLSNGIREVEKESRLRSQLGEPKAITATAHKLARNFYTVMR